MKQFCAHLIKEVKNEKIKSFSNLEAVKEKIAKSLGLQMPTNADIRAFYEKELAKGKITKNKNLEAFLKSKKIRTISGVAVVAVLTEPLPCLGKCLYCPDEKDMPKSYLSNEPAVMRAISANFNPYKQVQRRLEALFLNGHDTSKIELIVMGGTFSHLPENYQAWFIKECFRACNEYNLQLTTYNSQHERFSVSFPRRRESRKIKNQNNNLLDSRLRGNDTILKNMVGELKNEQIINEMALCRIVGLTLETRPDSINAEEIKKFRKLGCTRVELGVQSVFDLVLEKNRRGHLTKETIKATGLLKNAGFKVCYHLMPGLLGSDRKKDYEMFGVIFSDSRFKPDLIKIYPCVVTKGSELYALWRKKKYKPLGNEEIKKLIVKIKKIVPRWVRINRIIRDIPESSILAGPNISNLRQLIEKEAECQCIRCREAKGICLPAKDINLKRTEYDASGGREIFLEMISPDGEKLFSLLRLRIFRKNGKNQAIIREVHTYGKLVGVAKKDKNASQHLGFGKKLILEAERIVFEEFKLKKISVISGVGVREYYKKLGYEMEGEDMMKKMENGKWKNQNDR